MRTGRLGEDALAEPPAEQPEHDWLLVLWMAARAVGAHGNAVGLAAAELEEKGEHVGEADPAEPLFDLAYQLERMILESVPPTVTECTVLARLVWALDEPGIEDQ